MLGHCRSRLPLFDRNKIFEVSTGVVEIIETDKGAPGTISFNVPGSHLTLKLGQQPISWLKNKKCADGAFVVIDGDDLHLHIVELKSSLSHKEWDKVKSQFEGMFLNCLSFLGVIERGAFKTISCHVAYSNENITKTASASPALLKPLVGAPKPLTTGSDFNAGAITLLGRSGIPLNRITRDTAGNGAHTL